MKFRPVSYKPAYFAFKDEQCSGVHIYITDYRKVKPFLTGLHIMDAINRLYPDKKIFDAGGRVSSFNKAMGTDQIRKMLMDQKPVDDILKSYQKGLREYMKKRSKYLIYK
jgi:uncharacterized protein YbbC (DUF1343 family)